MEIGSLVYVMWTKDGDMCGPEPGILRKKAEKFTVEIANGTLIKVPSYQVKRTEADLFEKYPENLKLVVYDKDGIYDVINSQKISDYDSRLYYIHPLSVRFETESGPSLKMKLNTYLTRYYFSVLNQGQLGNFECKDESLRKFLQIDVQESAPNPLNFQIPCKKTIQQDGPYCVVYSLANLFRRHPRILSKLENGGYPSYLLRLFFPKLDANKCPILPKAFWLTHQSKAVQNLVLTNVLYVLAKKYPEEFKLHFDTSKHFKIQTGGAFQMILNMPLADFFKTMYEHDLQHLDGMLLSVDYADGGGGHRIAIGRCDENLYFIDPNSEHSLEIRELNNRWIRLYENVYSVFWWSWPNPNEEDWWQEAKEQKIKFLEDKIKKEKAQAKKRQASERKPESFPKGAQARERQASERKSSTEWIQAQARLISAKIQTNKFQGLQSLKSLLTASCKLIRISDDEIETEVIQAKVMRDWSTKSALRYNLRL